MSDRVRKGISSGREGNRQSPTGRIIAHLVKSLPPRNLSKQASSLKYSMEGYTLRLEPLCVVCLWTMDGVEVCDDPTETGNVVLRRLQLPVHCRPWCWYCWCLHRLSLVPSLPCLWTDRVVFLAVAGCVRCVLYLLWHAGPLFVLEDSD